VRTRLEKLDRAALRLMRTRGHSPSAEGRLAAFTRIGEWGAVWAVIGLAAASVDAERRSRWLTAAAVGPASVGLNYLVKLTVRRPRPDLGRRLPPLAGAPSALSFPSAHATSSFAAATAMGRVAPAARVPLYCLATSLGLTRPYLGMHYPSDVIGGAALGLAIGAVVPGLSRPTPEERLADLAAGAGPA
jgi:membrane-associated phospholipid phosphatase